jgi:anti-sigma factor RsiW
MRSTFDDRRCIRAREHVSLRLDGELSQLESASLHAHLSRCADCRAFATDLEGLTTGVRTTPLERATLQLDLPGRRSVTRRALPAGGAVAAAAIAAVAAVALLTSSVQQRAPQSPTANAPAPMPNEVVENRALNRIALLPGVGRSVADVHGLRVPGDV